jgi:hypothetical protein
VSVVSELRYLRGHDRNISTIVMRSAGSLAAAIRRLSAPLVERDEATDGFG